MLKFINQNISKKSADHNVPMWPCEPSEVNFCFQSVNIIVDFKNLTDNWLNKTCDCQGEVLKYSLVSKQYKYSI